jgi:ribosomal protein S18 acetylase RimI-like enzyme
VGRTLEQTRRTLIRRGIQYRLSVGAFDGDDMVAVMATGFGHYRGEPCAYDIFTGVTPGHRGRGIAGGMLDYVAPSLARLGAERFVLEVIETNAPAVTAYERAGFETVRELACFVVPRDAVRNAASPDGITIEPIDKPDWITLRSFWDWQPSWQNSVESLERSTDAITLVGAFAGGELVGYGSLEEATTDVPQIAVARSHRRRGVGRALVGTMASMLPGPDGSLWVLNVDTASQTDLAFFAALGGSEFVRQYEMHRLI